MIRLEISGDNAQDFAAQLSTIAQLMAGTSAPAATTPKTTRGKAQSGPAESTVITPNAAQSDVSAISTPTADGDAAPATREDVQKKAVQYGQPSKGGPAALKELFVSMGTPNGKWSEITDEMLPGLNAQLDDLLA